MVVEVATGQLVRPGLQARLLGRLPLRGLLGGLRLLAGAPENTPGAAVVAPQGAVLQQDPVAVPQQQARGAVEAQCRWPSAQRDQPSPSPGEDTRLSLRTSATSARPLVTERDQIDEKLSSRRSADHTRTSTEGGSTRRSR